MSRHDGPPVGLVLGSMIAPEDIVRPAQLGERLGFNEVWMAEDYFFTAGISSAVATLAATSSIPVGTGIVSALVRHPALLAMEIATIARMYPRRFRAGIALGTPHMMKQIGVMPRSPLSAMRESITAVRSLLAGEEVTVEGSVYQFDKVRLTYPPLDPVSIYIGALGPKMLRVAGAIADGIVLPLFAGPSFVQWAREQLSAGSADSGREPHEHKVSVFVFFSVAKDGAEARRAVRDDLGLYLYLCCADQGVLFDVYGLADELRDMVARGGPDTVRQEITDIWYENLTVVGDPDECAARIRALLDAGADSVVLFPMPHDRAEEMVTMAAEEVFPRIR